jgi:hypothetical protein
VADPKPFASLSSGLLARKGAARPAMRPQGFGQVGNGLEDLGWDDMGHEAAKPADGPRDAAYDGFGEDADDDEPRIHHPTGLTPVQSPVHDQQAELAGRLGIDPEDEEFDETAELYDPNAEDPDDAEESLEIEDEIDSEPFKVTNPLEIPEGLELEDSEPLDLTDPWAEPEPVELTAPTFDPEPNELGDPSADPEPFELTERFEDFDPFQSSEEVPSPPPPPAPVFEASSGYEPVETYSPSPAYQPRAVPGMKAKAAFTLRLDPDRHLKLRLACAVNGRSAQQIVTDAVDRLLAAMPELDAMAEKAKRKG